MTCWRCSSGTTTPRPRRRRAAAASERGAGHDAPGAGGAGRARSQHRPSRRDGRRLRLRTSQFNRATQARRQIGSAIKPFIYAAAIERGMTADDHQVGRAGQVQDRLGHLGAAQLQARVPRARSRCAPPSPRASTPWPRSSWPRWASTGWSTSCAGSACLAAAATRCRWRSGPRTSALEEIAYALASLPGRRQARCSPVFITPHRRRRRARPRGAHRARPRAAQRLSPETAYIVTDLMKGVVEIGTGKKARELGRPAAGKTGTSTNYRDAWFFGFTPELLVRRLGRPRRLQARSATTSPAARSRVPIWLDRSCARPDGTAGPRLPRPARRRVRPRQPRNRRAGAPDEPEEPAHALQARHAPAGLPRTAAPAFSDARSSSANRPFPRSSRRTPRA